MPYASIPNVAALNAARPITAQSQPNASQVAGFIDDTAAVIDAILRGRNIALPVGTAATAAHAYLRHANAIGAWALTERSAPVAPESGSAWAAWQTVQKDLREGRIDLGAETSVNEGRARAPAAATAIFSMGMEL